MSTIVCARARVSHCVSVCVSASLAAFQPARFNFSFGFFSHCNFFAHIYKFLCRQIIFSIEIDKHTTAAKKNERDSQISYRYVNTMWWNFYAMWRNSIRYSTNLSVRVEMKKRKGRRRSVTLPYTYKTNCASIFGIAQPNVCCCCCRRICLDFIKKFWYFFLEKY